MGNLDCHPQVRKHFGEKLERENPGGWQEAHRRLYGYYREIPEKELPGTLEEMEPLFSSIAQAAAPGCTGKPDTFVRRKERKRKHGNTLRKRRK